MKVAIWTETTWALGRIALALQKHLAPEIEVHIFDWSQWAQTEALFAQGLWNRYDLVVSNTSLLHVPQKLGLPLPIELLQRSMVVLHAPRLDDGQFTEVLPKDLVPWCRAFAAVCHTGRDVAEAAVQRPVDWWPFGADTDVFPWCYRPRVLRRVGFIGGPGSIHVKRSDTFQAVVQAAGLEPVWIQGHGLEAGPAMFAGVDLLLVVSDFESGPLGAFEAAACGVPVLSKPVGNWWQVSVAVLCDSDEAFVAQLLHWATRPCDFQAYAEALTSEVRSRWNMRALIAEFAKPSLLRHR